MNGLTGEFRVRVITPALNEVCRLFPKVKPRMEVRRQALKLRYWPENHPQDENGRLLDLNWSWIRALPGKADVGELRIDDTIDDKDNLRVIFFVGDRAVRDPLPMIWVLSVLQKKRQDFTKNQIQVFKTRRLLVMERFYKYRA